MDDLRTLRHDLTKAQQAIRELVDSAVNQGTNIAALANGLSAVNAKTQRSSIPLSNLAIGTTDIPVTWDNPWPDAGYGVYAAVISGAGVLGTLFATLKSGTKTSTGCTVTVANTGLAIVAASALDVLGVRT